MRIVLDIRKSLEENAEAYFLAAKKAKGKIAGAERAVEKARAARDNTSSEAVVAERQAPKRIRRRAWYERFKWFWASNGMLVIAGRDAATNEAVIKKHADNPDIVFHTDAPGSPFVVVKTDGKEVPDQVLQEAADFCASHSRAWKLGLSSAEVYWVLPEQVTKEARAGEYLQRGGFMVYGKRTYVQPRLVLVAVPFEDKVMVAPETAAKAHHGGVAARVTQGDDKKSDAARKILGLLGVGDVDDVVPGLPTGGCKVTRMVLEKHAE
ncbi:DUF814 domain-containing protein [Candidatus Woesearchaeota archaeon]|nr:DUF814 domain-containing protein [Candidatus Woesearchaeota archaeon]